MTAQFQKQTLGTGAATADIVRVVNAISGNLESIFADMAQHPESGAVLLRSVVLASGSNQIPHTLGKVLTGWTLSRVRASATIYDTQDSQPLPSTYLTLVASAPVTVDLVVF